MNNCEADLKVYVAGHRGLVGSAIYRKLSEEGYKNIVSRTSKELDLRRQAETERFFEDERPEWVFLAAAKVGGILANSTYKAEFIYDNLAIGLNVINAAFRFESKKLLNLGSSCIYPREAPQPMKEEHLLTGALEPTNEPYAIAKISTIKLCRYYNEQHGTNFISVMPTNLYGPGDNFNLETAHVLPALIRKFHLAKLLKEGSFDLLVKDFKKYPLGFGFYNEINSEKQDDLISILKSLGITKDYVTVWGTGEVYREFLYVEDLANACVYLMEHVDSKDMRKVSPDYFVNVGTGVDIKLKDLIYLVKKIVGFNGEIMYDTSKPDGMPRKLLDVSKINELGWHPKMGLEEGIRKTYEWYVTNL
ncbi:MAG TPA: GDP-L-fucose synthase [Candidatus Hydrothermia bacterium]|nr:GDP-L-fucose synthase [Candidatus Atribacteria bacterium]HRD22844.1 GDP-L-fucose synthase [Candidatus Hydrothermia bacterium]